MADLHGWEAADRDWASLARTGQWADMGRLITDDILDTIAVTGTWAELPAIIQQKYGSLLDRVSYYLPFIPGENEAGWRASINGFKSINLVDQSGIS